MTAAQARNRPINSPITRFPDYQIPVALANLPLGQDEPVAMATWRSPDPPESSDDDRHAQQQ